MKRIFKSTIVIISLIVSNTFLASAITGPTTICSAGSTATYTVSGSIVMTGYTWSVPSIATIISGAGSRSITLRFNSVSMGNYLGVTGNGISEYLIIHVYPTFSAGPISGPTSVCTGQSGVNYSMPQVQYATGYTWIFPGSGATIASQSGNSVSLNFQSSFTSGTLIGYAYVPCGGVTSVFLTITASGSIPSPAGTISGSTSVSPGQTSVPYNVSPIGNATSYVWSLPGGASIASGAGTNNITVNFPSAFPGGNISVYGINGSCNGASSSLTIVAISLPSSASQISGSGAICTGISGTNKTYIVPIITNATSYAWSISGGAVPVGNTNSNTITLNFPASLPAGNITLSVYGINNFGSGASSSYQIVVYKPTGSVGQIVGITSVCPGQSDVIYSVPIIDNANYYFWQLPNEVNLISGNGTSSITVNYSSSFTSGNIFVFGVNGPCGAGTSSSIEVSVIVAPSSATSDRNNFCSNAGGNISLSAIGGSGTTLRWFTGSCGGTSLGTGNPFVTTAPNTTTTYYARMETSCGISSCASLTISVIPNLPVGITITGNVNLCNGMGSFVASVTNGGSSPSYQWLLNGNSVTNNTVGVPVYVYAPNTALNTGDQVSCRVTSNATCATNNPATSNIITITRTNPVTPSIYINTSPSITGGDANGPYLSICSGTSVIFTANSSHGGSYQWYSNGGVINGQTGSTYTSSTLTNDQRISVTASGIPGCVSSTTATSPNVRMIVTPTVGTPDAIVVSGGTEPTNILTNGTTTTTYSANATNNTGFNWSINNPAAGTINAATGVMTWANGFYGNVTIQVTANGCSGPSAYVTRNVMVDQNLPIMEADYLQETAIPDPDNRPIITSLQVGSTAGGVSTTQIGGLLYSIPVFCSPGTNGVQPSLSLQYNSQTGNGLLGWGWNLGGLSSISRIVKPYYIDNEIKPINMESGDDYAIDGNRLVLESGGGVQGADGSKYKTEQESFTETIAHGVSGNGPTWFEVKNLKNNSILEYGNAENAYLKDSQNTRLAWFLTKYIDANRNYIKYNYLKDPDSGQIYLYSVQYTGNENANLDPYNQIELQYERRSDPVTYYQAGVEFKNRLLISNILVKCQGTTVRTYSFDYTYNIYSLLVGVKETAADGTTYNSTIFSWGDSSSQFSETASFDNNDGNKFYFGDFNGDGKDDFVRTPSKTKFSTTDKWELYLNQNGTDFTKSDEGNLSDNVISFKGKDHFFRKNLGLQTVDFDGNGLDDIVLIEYKEILPQDPEYAEWDYYWDPPFYNYQYKVYLSDGQHLNNNPELALNFNQNNAKVIFGDFNGDGKTDTYAINENDILYNYEIFPLDFNGDGKTDIMAINNNSSFDIEDACIIFDGNSTTEIYHSVFPTKWDRVFPGDFNGDGKTDLLTWSSSGWQIAYSNGNGFVSPHVNVPMTKNIDPDASDSDNNYHIGDFNGDGKSDIFEIYSNWQNGVSYDSKINVYYSNGDHFVKESNTFDEPGVYQGYLNFGDFNGDGKQECFYKGYYLDPATIIRMHPDEKEHLICSIANGYNLKTAISYNPLTDNTVYTKGSGAIFPIADFQKALYVVSSVTTNNGISETNTANYFYEGAKLHEQGKGLLGFSKLTSEDLITSTKSETTFSINTQSYGGKKYYNVYPSNSNQYINGTLVSVTVNNVPAIHTYDSGKRYFSYIPLSTTEDKIKNIKTEVSSEIDELGRLKSKISKAKISSDNVVSEVSESYTTFNPYGNPLDATITSTRGIESITHSKSFEYKDNGLLKKETKFFGSSPSVETSNTYDGFGNVLTNSVSSGSITRTNTYTYEPVYNRFVRTKTNPIGHTITYYNDPVTGNIKEEFDHTNLKTAYFYDGFGNITEKRYPNGQAVHDSIGWSLNVVGIGELYYAKSESQNNPTTITYYDFLGRELRSKTQSFNGTYLVTDKHYDTKGRIDKSFMPYFEGTPADQYVDYIYNDLTDIGRLQSETIHPSGTCTVYSYNNLETTINKNGQLYKKENDASGLLYKSTDPGGIITYNYNAEGKTKTIISPSGTTSIDYDNYGYQDKLHDIDAKTIDYDNNGFGEVTKQVDAEGNQSTMFYDALGRIDHKTWLGGETVTYTYNPGTGLLSGIAVPNRTQSFTYDNYYRVKTKTETIDNNSFTAEYTYDSYGNMTREVLNNNVTLDYIYNGYGYLWKLKANDQVVWTANSMNKYGQIDNYTMGNNTNTIVSYDGNGFVDKKETKIGATWIQNWDYDFEAVHGNMSKRKGINSAGGFLEENFTYDNLNRLLTYRIGTNSNSVLYDSEGKGNISTKSDIGTFNYVLPYAHRLDKITTPSSILSALPEQNITYTKFNKISTLTHTSAIDTRQLTVAYGPDEQRVKTIYTVNGITNETKYFGLGNYEKEIAADNTVRELYYISTPTGIAAILEKTGGQTNLYYIHTDILGSLDVATNSSGTLLERLSFDPWGRRRNPDDWTYNNVSTTFLFDRGFTGHEHLDQFDLINMNGRVYDPLLAMFLSPDNYVQAPDFTQNFNRYAYCLNNPLVYTDPSGDFFFATLASMFCPVLAPLGTIIDGALWSAAGDAAVQGIKIAAGKQDEFNFAELGGAAAGGAVTAGLSLSAPAGYIPSTGSMKNGNFSFKDYLSYYGSKASYTAYSTMVSSFVANGVTGYLSGNNGQSVNYNSIIKIGALSYLSSFANSVFEYFTWDRYSVSNRISALESEFSGTKINYESNLDCFGSVSPLDAHVSLGYRAMASRNSARSTMAHESVHVPEMEEMIANNWKGFNAGFIEASESRAYIHGILTQSKYRISMNDWLTTTKFIHKGGPYSYVVPRKYLFTFDPLKILRNFY